MNTNTASPLGQLGDALDALIERLFPKPRPAAVPVYRKAPVAIRRRPGVSPGIYRPFK